MIQEVVAGQDVADVEQIAEFNMMPELEQVSAGAAVSSLNKPMMSEFPVASFNMEMSFHLHVNKTHFYMEDCVPTLVLLVYAYFNMTSLAWRRGRYNLSACRVVVCSKNMVVVVCCQYLQKYEMIILLW